MISGGDPNSPMRTWAQMAPPRKPVTRIAPRTAVAGTAYRMAQARMIGPTTRVRSIAKPVSCNVLAICAGAKS